MKKGENVKIANIFSDGVVFQQNMPIYVFGEGKGTFSADFLGEHRETEADGKFCVSFSAHNYGGPYEMTCFLNGEKKIISDIMIGEVIFVAGQSNAELCIADTSDRNTHFDGDPLVRFFAPTRPSVNDRLEPVPLESEYNEKWTSLTGENARDWSAISLHTALGFRRKKGVCVGVLTCFKGAVVIQAFLSEEANKKFVIDKDKLFVDHFIPEFIWNKPAYIYHYMLEKIVPFSVNSVVWYQGESNRSIYEGEIYDEMLKMLIKEFRTLLKNEKLPFVVIEINYHPVNTGDDGVLAIQQAQARAVMQTDNTRLVIIKDLGEYENIHPENKREVSKRVLGALNELNVL